MRRTARKEARMADEQQVEEQQTETTEVDYKAKYEELLRHSREWEKKAKANKAAADELEQLKSAQMTEAERLTKERDEYKAQVEAYKAERERSQWVAEVAEATGVPVDLLAMIAATDKDDLEAKAQALAGKYGEQSAAKQSVPAILGDGIRPDLKGASQGPAEDFAAFMKKAFH